MWGSSLAPATEGSSNVSYRAVHYPGEVNFGPFCGAPNARLRIEWRTPMEGVMGLFGLGFSVFWMVGAAAGGGLVLACFADIRFAVPGAKLTTAHGPLNLPAEYGLSWLLPRLIGGSRAMELLISSRKFLTDEAHAIGLVHRLVSSEDLMAETRAYARDLIVRVSPESAYQSKRQTYLDFHRDIGAAVREANDLLNQMVKKPEYKEAIAAFLEKRPADWTKNDE